MKIFFDANATKKYTGFSYIYNQIQNIYSNDSIFLKKNFDAKYHYYKLLYLPFLVLFFGFFRRRTKSSQGVFVGIPDSFQKLLFLTNENVDLYLVDSTYEYYKLRFIKYNYLLRILLLIPPFIYELSLFNFGFNYIYINSKIVSAKMNKRLLSLNFGSKCNVKFLPIGINCNQYLNDDFLSISNVSKYNYMYDIFIWGNFNFLENRNGLTKFLKWLNIHDKKLRIGLAGLGVSSLSVNFDSANIDYLGPVHNLSYYIKLSRTVALVSDGTNGIKTKLLEMLLLKKPILTENYHFEHLGIPSSAFKNVIQFDYSCDSSIVIEKLLTHTASDQDINSLIDWSRFDDILRADML